jgi:hypothetical protein
MEAIRTHQMSDVRVSARMKIIDAGHMVAGVDQPPAQVRSQETSAAGYCDPFCSLGVARCCIRKAIICHRLQP